MNNKKEYAIGDTVQIGLLTFVCKKYICNCIWYDRCMECDIYDIHKDKKSICKTIIGNCEANSRVDNKDVIFKLKTK